MIQAVLMIGDRLVRIDSFDRPIPFLRYHFRTSISPTLTTVDDISTSTYTSWDYEFSTQEITFTLARRIGFDTYEYQFDHVASNQRFGFAIQDRIEVPAQEPTGQVNLNILAKKCKKRPRVKKLLLAFLRNP